ncbi:MAG: AbrB/MazE/SpoVT family DNA-binding domain-containing protein [Anaerolineales bacterium]|nr:AbrB/MazE/SpoVT family DNA-binding domain-containing protein [Anaerolineales bacterium]
MKTKIIKIGNSQGVRIPKTMIEQARLGDEVELELKADYLVIKPASSPRTGWADAFAKAPIDNEILPMLENEWDEEGWEW